MKKKFVHAQVMRQNTGNWKFDIKSHKEYINPAYIKRISPKGDGTCYDLWMEGDDQQYSTAVIDEESLRKILEAE